MQYDRAKSFEKVEGKREKERQQNQEAFEAALNSYQSIVKVRKKERKKILIYFI